MPRKNAETTIREALKNVMSAGEANACEIWKGYSMSTGLAGWHYKPFGHNAVYIGNTIAEAVEWIDGLAEERRQR